MIASLQIKLKVKKVSTFLRTTAFIWNENEDAYVVKFFPTLFKEKKSLRRVIWRHLKQKRPWTPEVALKNKRNNIRLSKATKIF